MDWEIIVIIVLAVLVFAAVIALAVLYRRYSAEKKRSREKAAGAEFAEEIKQKGGVRYSEDDAVSRGGEANVTYRKGDFMLPRGKEFTAVRGGELMPGTYTALAASDSATSFKLRVGGLVRTFSHGDTIVLAEGEEVCAVSCAVILR